MTSRNRDADDEGDELPEDSWDNDDIESWDDDDEDATFPCPHCGEPVYEDAERCPHCEQYLSDEDAPAEAKPWWIVAGVIAVLAMVYWWTVGR